MQKEKDLGTIKEVHCSGVSVTTTGAKVFMANAVKGDRIIEVDGKQQVAKKVAETVDASKNKKRGKASVVNELLNDEKEQTIIKELVETSKVLPLSNPGMTQPLLSDVKGDSK